MEKLTTAFGLIGFRPNEIEVVYRIVIAVHLLKQLDFRPTDDEGSIPSDAELISNVARLLEVQTEDLTTTLTTAAIVTRSEITRRRLSQGEARTAAKSLAKAIYSRLFDFVVYSVNRLFAHSLNVYGESASIGVLDIFGFEDLASNSLEQLCVNTANEQLNFHFRQFMFCWEREEYAAEGISVGDHFGASVTELVDNRQVIKLN